MRFMNHLQFLKIGSQILEKNPLKGKDDVGDHFYHLWGMGASLIAHSSQTKNNRNLWFVLLNIAEDLVYESSIIFKSWLAHTRGKPS